jgi:hypothetical protein
LQLPNFDYGSARVFRLFPRLRNARGMPGAIAVSDFFAAYMTTP